jgi:hypothetical protein
MPAPASEQQAYMDKFAVSQSSMKDWKLLSPMRWYKTWVTKELPRPKKPSTKLGSFLDCLMFTPDDLEKRFVIADVDLPSDKIQLILEDMFEHVNTLNKNAAMINKAEGKKIPMKPHVFDDKGLITSLCIKHDHYKKKADSQGYNDVLKKGGPYFEFLKSTKGRDVISSETNIMAIGLKEILLNDKVSRGFFVPKKNCEVVFQQRIFSEFELNGFNNVEFLPTKGAIDIVHFNHKRREVREVDLKCTNDAYLFWESIRKFDYPGQHSFYDYLLREWLKKYQDGKYEDYSVMNPLNVVIDDAEKVPYIYSYSPEDLHIKRYGIEGTPIRGWEDTINDIAWHFDNGEWTRPREHLMNGYMSVKTFSKR